MTRSIHPNAVLAKAACLMIAVSGSAWAGTAGYRSVILGDSPLVYYELDETSGPTAANSGSLGAAFNATIAGTVNLGQPSFGQGGTAYQFVNGLAGVAGGLPNSLPEWTVESWVNYSSGSSSNFLSNDQGGWNDDVLIGLGAENNNIPAGTVGLVHQGNPGSVRETVSQAIDSGQWYYVVMTGSESTGELRLYVDGALVDTNSALSNGATFNGADGFGSAPHLTLGHARASISELNDRRYEGLLDEVAIYDSVLDATTIMTHFNAASSSSGTPPIIVALNPVDGAGDVLLSTNLEAIFSEPLALTDLGTVTIRNLTLGAGSDVTISLPNAQVSVSGATLTIDPTSDLDLNTAYAIRISADAVEDISGDAFAGILNDDDWNFMTVIAPDTTAPTILSTAPTDGAGIVDPSVSLVATFDEPVTLSGSGSVTIRNLSLGSGSDTVISLPDARVSVSGTDLTINPSADLNFSTSYAIQISGDAVEDVAGNAFTGIIDDVAWNFMTMVEVPAGSVAPGAWSLAILPDTQRYADVYPGIFSSQTAWIRDNVRRRNIRYVMHLGDVTEHNSDLEWGRARASMEVMDGAVPYTIVAGNHDYGPGGNARTRDTLMNNYFSYGETAAWPTFGGAMEVSKLDNTYHLFEAGGVEWIIFNLEWGPRDSTIAWARGIYDLHPTRKGILITHAYMYSDETRYDHTGPVQAWNPHAAVYSTPGGVNDGQELWDKFVKDYNFGLVVNGHVLNDGTGYLLENNVAGDPVHQMLINYQTRSLGGEGYMRILEFQPDGQTVNVTSYSPVYDSFLTASDHQFSVQLPLGAADADSDGVLDYYDPDFDTDGDGLNNYEEFVVYGTHSDMSDSDGDGDGIADAEEVSAGTDPLRSDAATIALIQAAPADFGLFTEQMILDLNPETTFRIDGNDVIIDVQMRRGDDLMNWIDEGAPLNWTMPKPADKQFYRLQFDEGTGTP